MKSSRRSDKSLRKQYSLTRHSIQHYLLILYQSITPRERGKGAEEVHVVAVVAGKVEGGFNGFDGSARKRVTVC